MVAVAPDALIVPENVLLPVKVCVPARIANSLEVFGSVKVRVVAVLIPERLNSARLVASASFTRLKMASDTSCGTPTSFQIVPVHTPTVASSATLTAPGAGLRHYITGLRIERHAAALLVAGTTPVVVTTTNLPGALAFSIPMEAAAQGSVYEKALDPVRAVMASAQNTATAIVAPLTTSVIWRISATFYVAP